MSTKKLHPKKVPTKEAPLASNPSTSASEDHIPKVFISYSHDSVEHKQWVGDFASNLVKNGVDTVLDQWSLSFGDDVAKFMENGVADSDKVLMICTEPYVTKVNDGIGGVGYEALIVTSELIQDLGTSKFIPVIRQSSDSPILPKALGTRYYVDMSTEDDYENNFESLLRELHKEPLLKKPSLGKNPFGTTPSGDDLPPVNLSQSAIETDYDYSMYPEPDLYKEARSIINRDDMAAWRRLIKKTHINNSSSLLEYRKTIEGHSPDTKEGLKEMVLNASTAMGPFISLGIAGVESGKKSFRNQRRLLDMITSPHDWNNAGASRIVSLPESIAFIYQAIHGAICVYTNQLYLAYDFVQQQSETRYAEKPIILWKNRRIMGWPHSLDVNSTLAYEVLNMIPEKWAWILDIFGDTDEFKSALISYYLMLNTLDYMDLMRQGDKNVLSTDDIQLDVPLNFIVGSDEISKRAYQYLIENKESMIPIIESSKIPIKDSINSWPAWMESIQKVYENWDRHSWRYRFPHANLFTDLFPNT